MNNINSRTLRVGQRVRHLPTGTSGVVRRRSYDSVIVLVEWDDGAHISWTQPALLAPVEKIERPTRFTIRRVSVGSKSNLPWCTYDTERPSWIGRSRTWTEAMGKVALDLGNGWPDFPDTEPWRRLAGVLEATSPVEHIEATA